MHLFLFSFLPLFKEILNVVYDKPRQYIEKQRLHFANKGPYSQSYGFSTRRIRMWELDHKEGWGLKNWCFQTVVLEKTLENPLDSKEIKAVNPKENQSWIFIESPCVGKIPGEGTHSSWTAGGLLHHIQIFYHWAIREVPITGITEYISAWICQANVCSSVLSHHNKDLEWWTLKPSALRSWTDDVIALR